MHSSYERRSDERLSDQIFNALVERVTKRIVEGDEVFNELYLRICERVGDAVIKKGSLLLGAVLLTVVFMKSDWTVIFKWLLTS